MDVLRPRLINIEGKIYRAYPNKQLHNSSGDEYGGDNVNNNLTTTVQPNNSYKIDVDDDGDDGNAIQKIGDRFRLKLKGISSVYFKHIFGTKGVAKRNLETETSTSIVIPKRDTEGDIEITGRSRSGISSAKTRIEVIVENAKQRQTPTHFLALPIDSKEVSEKFSEFQRNVMKTCGSCRGVSEDIFQLPERLHLTLGMAILNSKSEADDMSKRLHDVFRRVHSQHPLPSPLSVVVSGIEYMNDDPSEVDVLYAKLQESPDTKRLQLFCELLINECSSMGIIKTEERNLRLHITVMNSTFRRPQNDRGQEHARPDGQHGNPRFKKRVTFDARKITQMYKKFEFGETELKSLVVAARGSFEKTRKYHYEFEIPFSS